MKILKDSVIYLFGEIFARALPFLLLPYLTRKLGPAGFGELSYYQTFLALLIILFGFSQDGAVARYYYVYGKRNLYNLVCAGYVYTFLVFIIALIISWWMRSLVMMAIVGASLTNCILNLQLTLRQCDKRPFEYSILQIISGVLCSMLTVLLLEYTEGELVVKRFLALMVGNGIVSLWAVWYFVSRCNRGLYLTKYRIKQSIKYIFAFGTPLILHHGAIFIKGQLDRVILFPIYPIDQIGVYSAGLQLASILGVLLLAVNKAITPYYYQFLNSRYLNSQKIKYLMWLSILLVSFPILFVGLLPESVFLWLLGVQYTGVKWYVCLFLIGFGLLAPYYVLVNYLFYHGWNSRVSALSLLSASIYLVVLAATAPLGPQWTPFAMIAGAAVILPLLYRQVKD